VEVSEENIKEALRALFLYANLKAEPTGALALGAVFQNRESFAGKSICVVVSGGNVDPKKYASLIS